MKNKLLNWWLSAANFTLPRFFLIVRVDCIQQIWITSWFFSSDIYFFQLTQQGQNCVYEKKILRGGGGRGGAGNLLSFKIKQISYSVAYNIVPKCKNKFLLLLCGLQYCSKVDEKLCLNLHKANASNHYWHFHLIFKKVNHMDLFLQIFSVMSKDYNSVNNCGDNAELV